MNGGLKGRRTTALRMVLAIDGSGVGLLSAVAIGSKLQRGSSTPDRRGLTLTAMTGIAGFGLAVAAVRWATRSPAILGASRQGIRVAQRLILAGLAVNTVGCVAVLTAFPCSEKVARAAAVLLAGGNVLSAIYAHQLSAIRTRQLGQTKFPSEGEGVWPEPGRRPTRYRTFLPQRLVVVVIGWLFGGDS